MHHIICTRTKKSNQPGKVTTLKANGKIAEFKTYEEAQETAERLNRSPQSAHIHYSVEGGDE